jgi:response regulator RpfG family c-di-GMP phosphodiesterase
VSWNLVCYILYVDRRCTVGCCNVWTLETVTGLDSPPAELEPPPGCATILLVEDEEFVRQVTSEVLQSAGYHVLQAREAIEATVAFRRHRQDVRLLITDVVMPGQNGRDLACELRSGCPDLKTLFISG